MKPLPPRYLHHLALDPEERARLVEALRASACLLDGTDPATDEAMRTEVSHKLARQLREAALQLCDHGRLHGVRCRYCEAILPEGSYPTEGS